MGLAAKPHKILMDYNDILLAEGRFHMNYVLGKELRVGTVKDNHCNVLLLKEIKHNGGHTKRTDSWLLKNTSSGVALCV